MGINVSSNSLLGQQKIESADYRAGWVVPIRAQCPSMDTAARRSNGRIFTLLLGLRLRKACQPTRRPGVDDSLCKLRDSDFSLVVTCPAVILVVAGKDGKDQ